MGIELLVERLQAEDQDIRLKAIRKLAALGMRTSNTKKYQLAIKALTHAMKNDPSNVNRGKASEYINRLSKHSFVQKKTKSKRKNILHFVPTLVFMAILAVVAISLFPSLKKGILQEQDIAPSQEKKIDKLFQPLNVEEVTPPELKTGIILKFRPHLAYKDKSQIRELTIQRSGGKEINKTEISFALHQRVISLLPKGLYEMEYRTSMARSPVLLRNLGYPDPGKKLRKVFLPDGTVDSISGDLYGLVPGFAFLNRYIFPVTPLTLGAKWKSNIKRADISANTQFKFEKLVRIKGKKFIYVTYSSQMIMESLAYKTSVEQKVKGEIYLNYLDKAPVYNKEVALINIKKPDSYLGLEIKTVHTEIFSQASALLK